jgi:DNA-binding MarR family transcriptional regulator
MFGELEIFLKEIDSSNKAFERKHFEKLVVTVYYLSGRHEEPVKLKNVKDKTKMTSAQMKRSIEDAFKKGYLVVEESSDEDIEELKITQTGRRYVENLLD